MVEHQSTTLSPEVLEEKRQALVAQAVEAAPQVLKAVLDEALCGDIKAARLVFEIAGFLQRQGSFIATQVNVPQITITPEELAELEKSLR
jgi:phage terminase large subunit GpA-like protein